MGSGRSSSLPSTDDIKKRALPDFFALNTLLGIYTTCVGRRREFHYKLFTLGLWKKRVLPDFFALNTLLGTSKTCVARRRKFHCKLPTHRLWKVQLSSFNI
jgi:hypothetical protein